MKLFILSLAVTFLLSGFNSLQAENKPVESIVGKWELRTYHKEGSKKILSTVFITDFRSDSTYTIFSTMYNRSGGADSTYEHDGAYKFKKVKSLEPGWPGEKVKGKQLYLLTREMNKKKGFIMKRYVQFENENEVWIWGKAPGMAGLNRRIVEEKK